MISNLVCENVDLSLYDFDYEYCMHLATLFDKIDFGVANKESYFLKHNKRNKQTDELLTRIKSALTPCRYNQWLEDRNIDPSHFFSLGHELLSEQDLLDIYLYPEDHILDKFGYRPVEGPVFCDYRNGRLVGVGVRNISKDLQWVAVAKFTFSNYGFSLFGFDDYQSNDLVYVVEGIFDAVALRSIGLNAIALGSALPSPFQIACINQKFNDIRLCLDNDFHGWCGAMTAHLLTGWPVYSTIEKDAGCGDVELFEFNMNDLANKIKIGVEEFNVAAANGTLCRNLSYNV